MTQSLVMQSEKPPYQIRKVDGEWWLRKWVIFQEHEVLCYLGSFSSWISAMVVGEEDWIQGGIL